MLTGPPNVITRRRLFVGAAALALLMGLASAADAKTRAECEREYTPQRAQDGKDVIWLPTEDGIVARMLEMAKVTADDKIYDLGAGDGKIPIAAGKLFGATAIGIEYDADLVKHAQCLAEAEGVADRVQIVQGDIFETDFSDATVVTLYLTTVLNVRLRPTLLAMQPGTRVLSYSFTMGEWDADEHLDTDDGSAYLWIVPANAAGTWTFRPDAGGEAFDVTLEQTFQRLSGAAGAAFVTGKLAGAMVDFAIGRGNAATRVSGTVQGDRISATVTRNGESRPYSATRN